MQVLRQILDQAESKLKQLEDEKNGSSEIDLKTVLDDGLKYISTSKIENQRNGLYLTNDFIGKRALDLIKKFNQELSNYEQDNSQTEMNKTLNKTSKEPDSFWQAAKKNGAVTPQPLSTLADARTQASSMANIKPSIKVQYLIASTVQSGLMLITKHSNDTVLQKSMLAMLNIWINRHEVVSSSMKRRGSMGEISNFSLPSIAQEKNTFTEKKRAPSVLLKPLADFAPKNNLFEIKNFNYSKAKEDAQRARIRQERLSETSSQREHKRQLRNKLGANMAIGLRRLMVNIQKNKDQEHINERMQVRADRKDFEAELMVRAIEEGRDQDKATRRKIRRVARKVTKKVSSLVQRQQSPLTPKGELFDDEEDQPYISQGNIAHQIFMEKQNAIDRIFGDPSLGPPWRRCRLYRGTDMEMLDELANESSESGSLSSHSNSDNSEEATEVDELKASPTIDLNQTFSQQQQRKLSSTMRSRKKSSVLDNMRDTGKLETIQEAKDERGSTITTILRGHVSDANFGHTLGPAMSTNGKERETIGPKSTKYTEADRKSSIADTVTKNSSIVAPVHHFPAAPKFVDMTTDVPFERKWRPIVPFKTRDKELVLDPDDKYSYQYDRRPVDQELFEAFQDQGDAMRKYGSINDLRDDIVFWRMEKGHALVAQDIVRKLTSLKPYDLYKMEPNGYNLSIQYESERKGVEAKNQAKEKKKKKLEEIQNAAGNQEGEIKEELERNKQIATNVASGKFGKIEAGGSVSQLKGGVGSKAMSQALEQLAYESGKRHADPIFTRGAELEITTMQDVEMLKAHLAHQKIHIPTQILEKAIIMPKDLETNPENHPQIIESLMINPFKKEKVVTKRGRKKDGGKGDKNKRLMKVGAGIGKNAPELAPTQGGKLLMNEKRQHKVFEFGNFPVLQNGKPRGGVYRMRLPADADWTGREKEVENDGKKNDEIKT